MKKGYKINTAGFGDAERIFNLIKQFPEELLARPLSEIVQNMDRFLVCKTNDNVVGAVSWQILPEIGKPRHPSIELKSLCVDKDHQRCGIGSALVRHATRRVKTLQPVQLIVLTFSPDFFAKQGFKQVPKESLIHKIYTGCMNCTKYDSPFTCPEVAMALEM